MPQSPLPPALRALLVQRHFHEPFPPAGVDELIAALDHVALTPGATLMRQGDAGDELYLVLDGRLSVGVEHDDGTTTTVDEIGPGGVVGEMALLTGAPRSATVQSIGRCDLARLSRADFERLAAHYPEALQEFLRRILPRLRRTQLVRVLTELFGDLDEAALRAIEARLAWVPLAGGATLFREGDGGDDVYIVVNGRLRVTTTDRDGRERVLEEIGRGAAVGELALLTGETHFWSRSRGELWHKGATSGNVQRVVQVWVDCDADTLLIQVEPAGPACHTGAVSCFYRTIGGKAVDSRLVNW